MKANRVRAKFAVVSIEATKNHHYPHQKDDGTPDYTKPEPVELRTITLAPVYGNGDPDHENTKFWQASPSGSIQLGTINPDAWAAFDLGAEYYVDFTRAPAE